MERATLDALAWGAVGALTFLVLAQAYRFVDDSSVGFLPLLGVAVAVFAVTTAAARAFPARLS